MGTSIFRSFKEGHAYWLLKNAEKRCYAHYKLFLCNKHFSGKMEIIRSIIVPLHKDSDDEIALNNRPISFLEIMSKVCERVALDQLNTYLMVNHRLSPHQNGNKKLHSTETLNVYITDTILEAIDKKKITGKQH